MAEQELEKITPVSVEALHLDNESNPRLPASLVGSDDRDILDYMVLKGNALELMRSIGEKGYFPGEPLLVVKNPDNNGFTVVEGNRRLSAVMLLHKPRLATVKKESLIKAAGEAKHKPTDIPVIIYSSRDNILDYLGYRHITGIKEWDSLAKAKYLRQLYERSTATDPRKISIELAKIIGSRPDYVRKLLCALSVYDQIQDSGYFKIKGLGEAVSFSLITTALGYRKIQDFLGLKSGEEISPEGLFIENLSDLTIWMFDKREGKTRVGESRNLSQLASIVGNDDALKEFRDGKSLETAFLLSEGAVEAVVKAIWEAGEKLEVAYNYVRDMTLEESELKKLDSISKTALAIKKIATPEHDD